MSALDTTFRRNFIVVLIAHVVVVGGLISIELWMPTYSRATTTSIPVELVVPAAPLGELPVGTGHGRGAYTPPPPAPPSPPDTSSGNGAGTPSDETLAPPPPVPTPPRPPTPHSNDIGIPKPTKKTVKPTPVTSNNTVKPVKPGPSGANTGTAKPGPTADQIRSRFLSALRGNGGNGTPGGTPYGDNRPAGGGTGRGKIGSPDGSPDGVAGGVGQGSPHWQYYTHVHDKMYEAWDKSIAMNDHNLLSIVTIKVARDGNIVSVTLKRSSGNKMMDNTALAAARKVQMLEPPPEALVKGSAAEISVDFQMEG